MKHYVYLAGPIAGLSYNNCTEWRDAVAKELNSESIHCLSPMRGKSLLAGEGSISAGAYDSPVVTSKGVMGRDSFDTHRASALFVNFLGAKKVSIGTVMEMAWAWKLGTPVVCVLESDNIHRHIMLCEAMTYQVPTVEDGIALMKTLLEPDTTPRGIANTCGYHLHLSGQNATFSPTGCDLCKTSK